MDLKSDDIFNIELDPTLILSYELDMLNLESIPNDIFEFSEEVPKKEVNSDSEKKVNESHDASDLGVSKLLPGDKSEIKIQAQSRIQKRKKDINGNDKPISGENLHCLIQDLNLSENLEPSDSDNETSEESSASKLKERAPIRPHRRANKSRYENNILSRNESNDRSQFNNERLKFLSGSSHVQFSDASAVNRFTYNKDLTLNFNKNDSLTTLSNQDSLFEDIRASGVSSPESGYDSSIPGSPPKVSCSVSLNLDFIPETVDEQIILDFLVENTTDCALPDLNLSSCNLERKDDKDKINDIISYLKDTPVEENELIGAPVEPPSECIHEHVPLDRNAPDLPVPALSVATKAGLSSTETPKKIVYKKLDDKAKKALREFISVDEFLVTQKKIYQRIQEDKDNKREIKVIYVADETDKASENRTNLHYAVLNSKIEDIFCLVEIQKQYNKPFTDINIRDKYGKTALDYAIQNKMALVIDYLKENTACQSVNI